MPLNTQEDYERLGEHLYAIDAPLESFAARHHYTVYHPLSGGRYPNRRITQEGIIRRSIHIAMADKPSGERFDSYFPQIPYTIFGSAWIDDHQQHQRWRSPFLGMRDQVCDCSQSSPRFRYYELRFAKGLASYD